MSATNIKIKFAIYQFLLQYFVEQKHLVAFSVIVQAYWRLKVDGSQIILSGDLAPPDECVRIGKSGKNVIFKLVEREGSNITL